MAIENLSIPPRLIPSTRFNLALLIFLGGLIQFVQRVNLSIAIVCMVNKTISIEIEALPHLDQINDRPMKVTEKYGTQLFNEKQFPWTELQQQIILSAYWIGYVLTLVPGSWLTMAIGAKKMYAYCVMTSSIATLALLIIYLFENGHFFLVLILRIIVGAGHGPLFPATYTLWSLWAVPEERGTLTSIGFCGANFGTSITMLIGGLLCRYINSGWMYLFLFSSLPGFLWLPLWLWQVSDSPEHHPTISEQERDYICNIIGKNNLIRKSQWASLTSLPWSRVIRSKPISALFITQSCNLFGFSFFLLNFGKLLTEIHHISTQTTGYVLAGGFILMSISSIAAGRAADSLVRASLISLTNVRKLFNSLSSFLSVLCMIAFYFCDESLQIFGIITTLIFILSTGFTHGAGFIVNFADVAPAYSGLIYAVSTSFASLSAITGSIIAGIIIKKPVLSDWQHLFILFGVIYFLGGVVYIIFGSAIPRKWATFSQQNSTMTIGKEDEEKEVSVF